MNTENKNPENINININKFILRREMLQAGDVICTREDTPTSNLIRKSLSCDYSHVLLYISTSSCIHADGDGVHSLNIQRLLLDNESDFKVLRPKLISTESANSTIQYARRMIGTEYSKFDAGKSGFARKFKSQLKIESKYQFCSRLVAEAFDAGGNRFFSEPSICTPADILESEFFEVVSSVVRQATPEEIEFSEDKSKDSISKQKIITNNILASARDLFSTKDVQTFEDLLRWVIKNPQHDSKVSSIVMDSGYLTMWAEDVIKNPYRYFKTNYPSKHVINSLPVDWLNFELALANGDTERYEKNRVEHRILYEMHPLDTVYQQVNLYQTLVSLSLQRAELFNWLIKEKTKNSGS